MSDQNNQQKGFFGTAASGIGMFHSQFFASIIWPFFLSHQHRRIWYVRKQANSTGNTLGAATNTVGKGVQGVTDATGNVVAAGGKGLGDAVTGITQGVGDTTKGTFTSCVCGWLGVFRGERGSGGWERNVGRRWGRILADMR
jgi:hypothetical protein